MEEINPRVTQLRAKMTTMKAAYLNEKITYEELERAALEYIEYMKEVKRTNKKLRNMRIPSTVELIRKF